MIDRTRCVRGNLVPVMSDDHVPGRRSRFGLSRDDFERVVQGYACPACLAFWDDGPRMKCPLCLHERSAADFLTGVKEWEEYKAYVQGELDNPTRTETPKPHEIVEEISRANGVKPTFDRGIQVR